MSPGTGPQVGARVVHRRYVTAHEAHYGGGLVDGAWSLGLFGDAATELCIRTDGDEGLFAAYSDVQFRAPIRAGDVVEVEAVLVRAGRRSREVAFTCSVVCRADPERSASASRVLDPPLLATAATGTVVVPAPHPGGHAPSTTDHSGVSSDDTPTGGRTSDAEAVTDDPW
jgi:3-aminobutyryl-CoA ammonia-lyase